MPASIIINQATLSPGVAGKARSDGVVGQLVTCTNNTVESSYLWTLVDVPIRSALVRGTTGTAASFTFTPDVKGTYIVSLRTNGSVAPAENDSTYIAIRTFAPRTLGWRYQGSGETTEDNEDYPGLGFPGNTNVRGWATNKDLIFEEIEDGIWEVQNAITTFSGLVSRLVMTDPATGKVSTTLISGTAPTGPAGGDLSGTYPNPSVVALRGRAIVTPFNPLDGQTIWWNNSTSQFELTSDIVAQAAGVSAAMQDGTLSTPSIRFKSDPDTGLVYNAGVAIVHDATLIAQFDTTQLRTYESILPHVTSSLNLGSSTNRWDTVYANRLEQPVSNERLRLQTIGGSTVTESVLIDTTLSLSASTAIRQSMVSITPEINQSGTALGYTALDVNVTETAVVGTDNRLLDLRKGGVTQMTVMSDGRVLAGFGTATLPGLSFAGDPDTGLYMTGAGAELRFAVQGGGRFQMGADNFSPLVDDSYNLGGKTLKWNRMFVGAGTAATPSISLGSGGDDGLYLVGGGGGTVGITTGGVERARFTNTASTLSTHWYPDISNTRDLGAPSQRWNLVYAARFDGFTGRFQTIQLTTNGTASAPSITWLSHADNGFFNISSDAMGATVDGVEVMRWQNVASTNPKTLIPDGSPAHPSLGFINDANTGLYRIGAGTVGITAAGVDVLRASAPGGANEQILVPNGITAPFWNVTPHYSFIGDEDTGFANSAANEVSIVTGTNVPLTVTTGQVQITGGSVGAPGLALKSKPDSGLFDTATLGLPGVGICYDGNFVALATYDPGAGHGILMTGDGSSTTPALGIGNTETGLWRAGDSLVVSVNRGEAFRFRDSTGGGTDFQAVAPVGSAAVPSYSFSGQESDGFYSSAANAISVAINATQRYVFSAASFSPAVDNTYTLGTASLRWSDLFAVNTTIGDLTLKDPNGGAAHWKVIEGENEIWAYNIRLGKKFKIVMDEVEITSTDTEIMNVERARFV